MSGHDASLRGKLKLTNELKYYHFQSQAELTIEGVDDKEEMKLTQEAFDIMGFSDEECMNMYSNTAGIMHMGEMKFKQRPREEQAEVDTGLYRFSCYLKRSSFKRTMRRTPLTTSESITRLSWKLWPNRVSVSAMWVFLVDLFNCVIV